MSRVIVIDCEMTTFPPHPAGNRLAVVSPHTNQASWNECRMMELAWIVMSSDGKVLQERQFLVRPKEPFQIAPGALAKHRITNEICNRDGYDITHVLGQFCRDLEDVGVIVAHHLDTDYNVIINEAIRAGDWQLPRKMATLRQVCTMKRCKNYYGGRPMRLDHFYEKLFGRSPTQQQHRAAGDVKICADIYRKIC